MKPFWAWPLLGFAVCSVLSSTVRAEEVVAVLSSDSAPYQEALAGLKETCGKPVRVLNLSREPFKVDANAIVVAFGGKAVIQATSVHEGPVISALSPGIQIRPRKHSGILIHVHTSPSVVVMVQKYKEIQPSLRRLAVLWISDSMTELLAQKESVASSSGVELLSVRLQSSEDLPNQLRNIQGKVDAIWMPLDARLVTPQNFAAVREFCLAQRIPFYVPSDGLVEKGATAAVYASFMDLGRLSGSMVQKVINGNLSLGHTSSVFPEKISVAINATAASLSGLKVGSDVLKKADKVVP